MLKLYNTLTGQKEPFQPLRPPTVTMYACGVTVYDFSHLGHARSALVFDVIRRYLEFSGYEVTYVRNFTDVDDKIINRATQEKTTSEVIAQTYLKAYQHDMKRMGIRPANREPKATDHMADIISLIEQLIQREHAYQIEDDVYFSVTSFPEYGRLSKRKLEDLLVGARVEVDERKRNPMDFALWKGAKPGEPSWTSPWGSGRPGWHIECSAMSMRHLGKTFDIHGGGMDLIFPHHENEMAQSCASTGLAFARYWIHNGFVQINQEKMSKSLGNFFTIREVFDKWSYPEQITAEVLRYFLLATQYRSPLDFSDQGLRETKRALDAFYDLFQRLEEVEQSALEGAGSIDSIISRFRHDCSQAMDDDFNTPVALAHFQKLRTEINRLLPTGLSPQEARTVKQAFRDLGQVLGLFQLSFREWEFKEMPLGSLKTGMMQGKSAAAGASSGLDGDSTTESLLSEQDIESIVAVRNEARRGKDFNRADELRQKLASYGITIEDKPDGTSRWKR